MTTLFARIKEEGNQGTIKDLVFPVSNTYDFSGKDHVVFINTGDVLEGKFLHKEFSEVSKLPGQAKKIIEKGDILFSEIRPKNKHFALVDFDAPDYVVSTKLMVLKVRPGIDPRFAYIVLTANATLKAFQDIAESRSGTFPQITFDAIADFEITLPDYKTQKAIAEVLSSYDEKIVNNDLIVNSLEATAQAIFDEWFVKFRFPGYEKAKFIESEIGDIPKGWEIKNLDQVADIVFGHNFQAKLFNESGLGVRVVRIRDVLDGATETFTTEVPAQEYQINVGDLLIGMDGTFHANFWFTAGCYLNQRVTRIRSNLPGYFIFESIRAQLNYLQKTITGATVGHLANGDIREFKILVPQDLSMMNIFGSVTNKILDLRKEILTLRESRDRLLAELI